jgi:L-aspartate oxidase
LFQDEASFQELHAGVLILWMIPPQEISIFRARKTMLATGGAARIYAHNTNPAVATGVGMAMARLAGAVWLIWNLFNFIPLLSGLHQVKLFSLASFERRRCYPTFTRW